MFSTTISHSQHVAALLSYGILGLGSDALLASFMSGMAGNVTAFNPSGPTTIYQSYIRPNASDAHYLMMGRWQRSLDRTFGGGSLRGDAFQQHHGHAQLVFAFVNAPLFALSCSACSGSAPPATEHSWD